MDHNEDRKKYSEMWTDQQASVNEYLKRCALNFSDEDYDRAVGLLWTNSFACKKSEGQVLFPVFSIISHSCVPNANAVLLNSQQLALEAKMDIQRGEEVTISYISILQVSKFTLRANNVLSFIPLCYRFRQTVIIC